jgi:hypothetical protein
MPNRRTGKIARLPKQLRDQLNGMLRDGRTYKSVIAELALEDVNEDNVSLWHKGGHQDWLKEQDRLEDMQAKREFALEIVRQNEGSQLHQASLQLAASQLYEALTDFDITSLKVLLQEKPENYAQIVNSLAKLSKGALDIERFKEQVAEQKRKILEATQVAKREGGLTPETLRAIEEAAGLL